MKIFANFDFQLNGLGYSIEHSSVTINNEYIKDVVRYHIHYNEIEFFELIGKGYINPKFRLDCVDIPGERGVTHYSMYADQTYDFSYIDIPESKFLEVTKSLAEIACCGIYYRSHRDYPEGYWVLSTEE